MRRTAAAGPLFAGDDGIVIRTGADLNPCVMTPDMRFPKWRRKG